MPWKPDPDMCRVEFVLSTEERNALGHAAIDARMSISAYCARAVMAHEPLVEALWGIETVYAEYCNSKPDVHSTAYDLVQTAIGEARAALTKAKGAEK